MVVVVIIGILVAIAIPVYTAVQDRAAISAIQASVRTLNGATAMFHAINGTFPAGASANNAVEVVAILTGSTLGGPYLQTTPTWPTAKGTTNGLAYTDATGRFTYHWNGETYAGN